MTLNINIKSHKELGIDYLQPKEVSISNQNSLRKYTRYIMPRTHSWLLFVSLFIFYLGRLHTSAAENNAEPSKQQDPENTKGIPCFL